MPGEAGALLDAMVERDQQRLFAVVGPFLIGAMLLLIDIGDADLPIARFIVFRLLSIEIAGSVVELALNLPVGDATPPTRRRRGHSAASIAGVCCHRRHTR